MGTRFALAAALAAGFGWAAALAEDVAYQYREPEKFWLQRPVIQKRGIVVEDDDYIVRERYWILDRSAEGTVVEVTPAEGRMFLSVRFREVAPGDMGPGWTTVGEAIRDRVVSSTETTVTIRRDPYGDGTEIERDEMKFQYRIEGRKVDPADCGLIVKRDAGAWTVRFPSALVALPSPRVGDKVRRSVDWQDGYCDGGRTPDFRAEDFAIDGSGGQPRCVGTVLSARDEKGFLDIQWDLTKRKKSHRFDHRGFYDIERAPPEPDADK